VSADPLDASRDLRERENLEDLVLASDETLEVIDAWGVRHEGKEIAVPATFLVMPDGRVAFGYIGESMVDRPTAREILLTLDRELARDDEAREKSKRMKKKK